MSQEPLVNISGASQILGVSETALRQWTDKGKIKAFVTPGGHRRYSRAELKKFMSSHQKTLGIKDLVTRLEDTASVHHEIDMTFLRTTSWDDRLNQESQDYLASLGRRLLNLIIRCITEPSKQEEILKEVREVGHTFGETLSKLGLPLTDSVQAFIQHRDPIMTVTTELMKKHEGFNRRIIDAIPLADHALDEALVSLVTAHQQYQNGIQSEPKKETAR